MGKCPKSPRKRRNPRGKSKDRARIGKTNNYKRGMRGHSYKKTKYGRFCTRCKKMWFKPFQTVYIDAETKEKENNL